MSLPTVPTRIGLLLLAIIALSTTAAPASAETVADPAPAVVVDLGAAPRGIGSASPEHRATQLFDPLVVTSAEAPEITVVRPMAEGTFRNTSLYGPRWGTFHTGTDMAASVGTPILAIADGTVVQAGGGEHGRSGQLVIIHHVIDGLDV